jgi:hypothetical protein
LDGVQAAALGGLAERGEAGLLVGEGRQRHQLCGACEIGLDEPVEVVEHRPRDQLAERAVVTAVRLHHRRQVGGSLLLENDRRWVGRAEPG